MKFLKGPHPAPNAIAQMAKQFGGETELLRAAISASFFLSPEKVKAECRYPNHARSSRALYPGKGFGETVEVDGVSLILDSNHKAQATWREASGFFFRASGYGVRHIWGYASDAKAYTATWNLCYMPFWAGMMTEDQHPFELLAKVVRQVSFDLYFREGPITNLQRPAFIQDPGLKLSDALPADTVINLI
ncbi:MAG: hypothetical protein H7039_12155 [Bryobacteraceae bacterium]|nr:hypothetical protein [Bryobacteraceae bacterium]